MTLCCILMHMALSASSFNFKLDKKRNTKIPILWPEGRAHSFFFAYRPLLVMLLRWMMYERIRDRKGKWFKLYVVIKSLICLLTHYFADIVSKYYENTNGSKNGTVRNMPMPKNMSKQFSKFLKAYYSSSVLMGNFAIIVEDGCPLLQVFAVQFSAFLATLVKKSILSTSSGHFYYVTISLNVGYWISFIMDFKFRDFSLSGYAYPMFLQMLLWFIRIHLGIDKYKIWTSIILIKFYYIGLFDFLF